MDVKKNGAPVGAPNNRTINSNTVAVTSQRIHEEYRKTRKDYIETKLCEVLKAKRDFEEIRYGRDIHTEQEYMRIRDIFGSHVTFNITNYEPHEILNCVCWIVLNGFIGDNGRVLPPDGIITDKQELRKLAPLFRR